MMYKKMIVLCAISLAVAIVSSCSSDEGNGDAADADSDTDSDSDTDADSDSETTSDDICDVDATTCGDGGDNFPDAGADASCGDYDCETYEGDGGYPFDNEGAPYLGNEGSPEVIVTGFSNFGCSHCRDASIVVGEIFGDSAYADRAVFYFGNFVGGSQSWNLHQAAQAAHLQGYFWEVHDYFYSDEFFDPLHGMYTNSEVRDAVASLGLLDMAVYDVDFSAESTTDYLSADETEICDFYKNCMAVSTPSIFVNGYLVHPWTKLKNVLDFVLGHTNSPPFKK